MASGPDHDGGYQGLFCHREMVADMMRTVFEEDLLELLELDAMERVNTKFISDRLNRREGDVVWRIPMRKGSSLYLCLMLEFQSTDTGWIAVRLMGYGGLLLEQVLKEQKPGKGHPRVLPLLLPVVLYNGDAPWTTPTSLRALLAVDESSPVWHCQPQLCYHLVDEKRFDTDEGSNPFSLICQLEACESTSEFEALLLRLREALQSEAFQRLQRSFAAWLQEALLPSKGLSLPDPDTHQLDEVIQMTRVNFAEQWMQQGYDKGQKSGFDSGRVDTMRSNIVRVYAWRFEVPMPEALRDVVLGCEDIELLEGWLKIVATESAEAFALSIPSDT